MMYPPRGCPETVISDSEFPPPRRCVLILVLARSRCAMTVDVNGLTTHGTW